MTALATPTRVSDPPWWRRLLEDRLLWLVLGVYLLARVFSAVLLVWVASRQDLATMPGADGATGPASYWDVTHVWDGGWYQTIVERGYPADLPRDATGVVQQNAWAFFPAYPLLVKVAMALTGGSFAYVAPMLSLLLGAAAVLLMVPLLRPRIGSTATLCVVAVFACAPASPVLQMAYTESLAMLLLVAFLLAISRDRWLLAGAVALAFGLTRPIAPPLAVVALVAVVWRWRRRGTEAIDPREYAGMIFTLMACAVSAFLWPAIVGAATGVSDAYTSVQGSWRGGGEVQFFTPWWNNFHYFFGDWAPVWLVGIGALVVASIAGPWAKAMGPVLRTWAAAYSLYLVAVTDVWTSTYRFLIFLFPLAIVWIGAGWTDRSRRVLMRTRTAGLVILGLGWQIWWCWTLVYVPSLPWNAI